MSKLVRYTGETKSAIRFSASTEKLVPGKTYNVIVEHFLGGTPLYYTLEGMHGTFDATWFVDVMENPIYLAISLEMPVVGQSLSCKKIHNCKMVDCFTTPVTEIKAVGEDTYFVETANSTYFVQVCLTDTE